MPVLKENIPALSATSNFIGLESYAEAQSNIFFGRSKETDELTNLVESNTLTIVFGKSGTGKTSLLNAGVFPRLRKHYCLPFRIRLEFSDDSADLITQVKQVLKQEVEKYGFSVESYPGNETLWEYFHKEPLWKTITPILVFDQFEEIFTLAKTNPRFGLKTQDAFWEELSDLIENSIPEKLKSQFLNEKEQINYGYKKQKTKILFAFREEFLPEFETLTAKIPSIKYSRFRLMPMNGNQAYEVISKSWNNNINEREANQIVSFFAPQDSDSSNELVTVEPSLLSQVCTFIDKERVKESGGKVSAELLTKYPKETIFRQIYEEAILESSNAISAVTLQENSQYNPVKEFLEEKLITSEGYRTKFSLSENEKNILPALEVLKKRYFLREEDGFIELTHDALVPIIKTDREKRRKEIALLAEKAKARKKALRLILFALLGAAALFYISTYSAREENDRLAQDISAKKVSIDSLKNQYDKQKERLDSIEKIRKGIINILPGGKTVAEQLSNDSTEITLLKSENDALTQKKIELEKVVTNLTDVINSLKAKLQETTTVTNPDNEAIIEALNQKIDSLTKVYNDIKAKYDALDKAWKDHMRLYHTLPPPTPAPAIDTNYNLKLNLYYGSRKSREKAPENLTIFLIPFNKANRKIINDSKLYEIRCDEYNIRKSEGYKVARYYNGAYVFSSVAKGKYLIKICTYYGGYYVYDKPTSGTDEFEWNASPPIR